LAAAFYSFCDVEPGVQEDLDRRQEEAKAEYSRLQGTFAAAHPGVVLESIPNPRQDPAERRDPPHHQKGMPACATSSRTPPASRTSSLSPPMREPRAFGRAWTATTWWST